MLTIYTTHLKESYLKRNGLPRSDKATFTGHWVRHGNYLTIATVITDPAFLTEPLVRTQTWVFDPSLRIGPDQCETAVEVPDKAPDFVPNHLPGTNPFLQEVADWYGLPLDGVRGGAMTLYPEVPAEDDDAGEAAASVRTVLRLRRRRSGVRRPDAAARTAMKAALLSRTRRGSGNAWIEPDACGPDGGARRHPRRFMSSLCKGTSICWRRPAAAISPSKWEPKAC